jgi:hypothetical protein
MARAEARAKGEQELWQRNDLQSYAAREGYKLEESKIISSRGTETVVLRLYKLVDTVTVTVESEIKSMIDNNPVQQGSDW